MRAPAAVVVSPSPAPTSILSPPPDQLLQEGSRRATQTAIDQLAASQRGTQLASDQSTDDTAETIEAALDWQAFVPTDTADHLATMDRAARDSGCGVPWHLLAAIARVESDFGRNMATSSAGAQGYGQFLPTSWQSFGNDGNVYDYRDALPAIATYLCQSGLERDPRAALFAYNHADWYVDLVLNLAVRFDRMAPGAPTPDVLDTGPAAEPTVPMHYAAGRDARQQTRARSLDGQADWLGVPWRGRSPGAPISPDTLETTSLAMVRAQFGLAGEPSKPADAPNQSMADRAWEAGLLPVQIQPPVLLPSPDDQRPGQEAQWSIGEIRRTLERGQPVVALVDAHLLPGHSPGEATGDQPIVLIGKTPTGLVYSDPSFSSSLGYGLELGDPEFLVAWQSASTPRQALALSPRPRPLAREAHFRVAEPPPVYARVLPTPVPPTSQPTLAPVATPIVAVETQPEAGVPIAAPTHTQAPPPADDRKWLIGVGALAILGAATILTRRRARRSV